MYRFSRSVIFIATLVMVLSIGSSNASAQLSPAPARFALPDRDDYYLVVDITEYKTWSRTCIQLFTSEDVFVAEGCVRGAGTVAVNGPFTHTWDSGDTVYEVEINPPTIGQILTARIRIPIKKDDSKISIATA